MRSDQLEQALLALTALLPGLGEARRDHAKRANAAAERIVRRVEDPVGRQADDCELDRVGDLADRRVGTYARDRLPFQIDGERGPREVGVEDVAKELAPDRTTLSRCSDDGDRSRGKEWAQRGDDGGVVSLLDA